MKFKSHYSVFSCQHVFKNERPILEVVHDADGYWHFLCGHKHDHKKESLNHIEVGHLIKRDPTIAETVKLEVSAFAQRNEVGRKWRYGELS
jgi:hypothetical protein